MTIIQNSHFKNYYPNQNKRLKKEAHEKYQNFSEEEKGKRRKNARERY